MSATLRCAIYTRKSSEEGLDQSFNSLHAQREACEAYVLSQAGEGWSALKAAYDDGGFSGGSMDRPGLKALLGDIAKGPIDVVVVYKVDRLTRSLADFAKIVEAFDGQGVSFVSVTQAFNTTTSMGRLTLNVLLSFAQFEREVTGERIRDKIAASKKKGMWMGGVPPLGYDLPVDAVTRALVVNEPEAQTVRMIFGRYLELGSVHAVMAALAAEGIKSKAWISSKGQAKGGLPFNRGALFHLLRNRVYLGEITHGDIAYPGPHRPIVDHAIFDEVQRRLSAQAVRHRTRTTRVSTQPFKGLLFDADGAPMSPTFTRGRNGKLYRYYVSAPLQQGVRRQPEDEKIRRVPADAIESLVTGCLGRIARAADDARTAGLVRVEVHPTTVQLVIKRSAVFKRQSDPQAQLEALAARMGPEERVMPEADDDSLFRAILPCRLKFHGGKVWMTDHAGRVHPQRSKPDRTLIRALRTAHELILQNARSPSGKPQDLEPGPAPHRPYDRRLCRMAFLAPDIQTAILEGKQPPALSLATFMAEEIDPSWEKQRRAFGFPC